MIKSRNKTLLCLCLAMAVLLSSCGNEAESRDGPLSRRYYQYFDTVSTVYCYGNATAEEFEKNVAEISTILEKHHIFFDIYHEYSGVVNLCTINENAGGEPLPVDPELFAFLRRCVELYDETNGQMNVMMGSVLSLWHDCRQEAADDPSKAAVPDKEQLAEAAKHTDISLLELDESSFTVRISDPLAAIDVGAVGKGYAAERAADYLKTVEGGEHYVLDIGGNLRIMGAKPDGSAYRAAVKNPFDPDGQAADILSLKGVSCVTSGVYERYFTVDGQRYHHIIDPDTLYPSDRFLSVTVVTEDSGLADALSTALFCMSVEEGMALAEKRGDFEALWITADERYETVGLENYR